MSLFSTISYIFRKNLSVLFFIKAIFCFGQVFEKEQVLNFNQSHQEENVRMGGWLDGENTYSVTHSPTYYYQGFQPMISVKMTNKDTSIVKNPRLVFNDRGRWFDLQSIQEECFQSNSTFKEKALGVWTLFKNNRFHLQYPLIETTDLTLDYTHEGNPVKMLGVYGFGVCYNVSSSIALLPSNEAVYIESLDSYGHGVSQFKVGKEEAVIDADIETFYLKLDNKTLASRDDLQNDRYLVRRNQHYGKYNSYNPFMNDYISLFYGGRNKAKPNPIKNHTLDFSLRPGESIIYYFSSAGITYYQKGYYDDNMRNGEFVYEPDFYKTSLQNLVSYSNNLSTIRLDGQYPHIHPKDTALAVCIIPIESPFNILDADLVGNFYRSSIQDSLQIFFSKDSIHWFSKPIKNEVGSFTDQINFFNELDPLYKEPIYKYYLKFTFHKSSPDAVCGINSLQVKTKFLVSRFFLPYLKIGDNNIEYSDSNNGYTNVELDIKWKESFQNNPPDKIAASVYPLDNSHSDSLKFVFSWTVPVDNNGDKIVDYHFQLSDRADMKFPLSPVFDMYLNNENLDSIYPRFQIPEYGLLNAGTRYYWRVRSKDANGNWSEWSDTWSFVARGIMPPNNLKYNIKNGAVNLSWQYDTLGSKPVSYEVYASNEWHGFSPSESTLIAKVDTSFIALDIDSIPPKTFYRIIAIDSSHIKSGSSELLSLPYPFIFIRSDLNVVKQDSTIEIPVLFNKLWWSYPLYNPFLLFFIPDHIYDVTESYLVDGPSWISYDPSKKVIYANPSYEKIHPVKLDTVFKVRLRVMSKYLKIANNVDLYVPIKFDTTRIILNNDSSYIVASTLLDSSRVDIHDSTIYKGSSEILVYEDSLSHFIFHDTLNQVMIKDTLAISKDDLSQAVIAKDSLIQIVPNNVIELDPIILQKDSYIDSVSNKYSTFFISDFSNKNFSLAPNPAYDGFFKIYSSQSFINPAVKLFNSSGNECKSYFYQGETTLENEFFSVSDLPSGTYFLIISSSNSSVSTKLIIY